jgi:hypothetical protein
MGLRTTVTRIALLASVCLASSTAQMWTCECIGTTSPSQSLSHKDAVFIGHVVNVSLGARWVAHDAPRPADCDRRVEYVGAGVDLCFESETAVTLEVVSAWKGVDLGRVVIKTEAQGTACGYDFQVGESYLIYAERTGPTGDLSTSSCSLTKPERQAAGDRAELGPPMKSVFSCAIPTPEAKK